MHLEERLDRSPLCIHIRAYYTMGVIIVNPALYFFSAGIGRTGMFIALSNVIEQVKTHDVVDIYSTVKAMRQQRPGMVHTKVKMSSTMLSFSGNPGFVTGECLMRADVKRRNRRTYKVDLLTS